MRSYKDKLNDLSRKSSALRQLTSEEEKALKKLLIEMLRDIICLCDKHGLTWMMGGGSCLGTIRHKGFIPWDDDLDLNMPRRDAEKLKSLLKEHALGGDYEYTCPNSGKDAPCMFLQEGYKNAGIGARVFGLSTRRFYRHLHIGWSTSS